MKLPSYCKGLPQVTIRHDGSDYTLALDHNEHGDPELFAVFPENGGEAVDITNLLTAEAKEEMLSTAIALARAAA
ncbi:hypothetical protein JFK97_06055 [Chromobacterium phragmitis]|uniref:hypothetical protein n=1 Tax=Chromobacterium amazonense TaxID=1382803 RepID=UPI0021B84308|nr:hypothetical protein [Chromobacterium amazonense]MBM2883949.1 hypothetical protein [Chromobacterium amazonense]MDE1711867.1 hypothetical protein [Chromobacterium amazonense]